MFRGLALDMSIAVARPRQNFTGFLSYEDYGRNTCVISLSINRYVAGLRHKSLR